MSESFESLSQLSREELYSTINALKREVNCLATDVSRLEVIAKKCRQYLTDLVAFKLIDCDHTQELLDLIALNAARSRVTYGSSGGHSGDESDHKIIGQSNVLGSIGGQRGRDEISDELSGDEVVIKCESHLEDSDDTNAREQQLQKPFVCTECRKSFVSNRCLRIHLKSHKQWARVSPGRPKSGKTTKTGTALKAPKSRHTVESPQDMTTNEKSVNNKSLKSKPKGVVFKQTPEGRYVCDYADCGKSFANKNYCLQHRRSHSGATYRCDWPGCSATFSIKPMLTRHKVTHRPEKYRCDYEGCDYTTRLLSNLLNHKPRHSTTTYPCDWEGCSARFSTPKNMWSHRARMHRIKYRCDWPDCGYATGVSYILTQHRATHTRCEPRERLFTCPVSECGKTFGDKHAMTCHHLTQHPESVPDVPWIQCQHTGCPYRSKSKWAVRAHVKGHTKSYRCDECDKEFAHMSQLTGHKRSHDESLKYRCEWPGCEGRYVTPSAVKKHMIIHTGGGPVYRCSWPGCDKSYPYRYMIRDHEKIHREPDKYRCDWPGCGRQLNTSRSFKQHMAAHTGDPKYHKYRCHWPGCEYMTFENKRLVNHVNRNHKESGQ